MNKISFQKKSTQKAMKREENEQREKNQRWTLNGTSVALCHHTKMYNKFTCRDTTRVYFLCIKIKKVFPRTHTNVKVSSLGIFIFKNKEKKNLKKFHIQFNRNNETNEIAAKTDREVVCMKIKGP